MVAQTSLKRTLRWAYAALLIASVSMLGYCGFVLMDTWAFQKTERSHFNRMRAERPARYVKPDQTAPPPVPVNFPEATDGLIGRIDIPLLGVSVMVIEGTSGKTLRRAVGHISGTALPGQPGNIGISGHRDTFFRPLRKIQQNDIITVVTLLGEYRYRVVSTKIVSPGDLAVLNPGSKQILTLVTCYPFYFVGSAPDRFIVTAERIT